MAIPTIKYIATTILNIAQPQKKRSSYYSHSSYTDMEESDLDDSYNSQHYHQRSFPKVRNYI